MRDKGATCVEKLMDLDLGPTCYSGMMINDHVTRIRRARAGTIVRSSGMTGGMVNQMAAGQVCSIFDVN